MVLKSDTLLADIAMITKRDLLEEVVISSRRAIMIKGDTLEFVADSFQVGAFDNVDELLRRLPGIEVDKDGNITAHGKQVQKMYVDGEEFFSEDPNVLAKTLKASSIDKVQVYDDKTEMAKNTGIDDGEKVKTINLTLKDHAKTGQIGKVGAGYGTDNRYKLDGNILMYNAKRKFGVILMNGNVNDISVGWNAGNEYGFNDYTEIEDGYFVGTSDEINVNEGEPNVLKTGVQYDEKFLDKKLNLNVAYNLQHYTSRLDENSTSQFILPDTQYYKYGDRSEENASTKQGARVTTKYNIDSLQEITLKVKGNFSNSTSNLQSISEAKNINGDLVNSSNTTSSMHTSSNNISANLMYNKKFKKEGRSVRLNLSTNTTERHEDQRLLSLNTIYFDNSEINYDQDKTIINNNQSNSF